MIEETPIARLRASRSASSAVAISGPTPPAPKVIVGNSDDEDDMFWKQFDVASPKNAAGKAKSPSSNFVVRSKSTATYEQNQQKVQQDEVREEAEEAERGRGDNIENSRERIDVLDSFDSSPPPISGHRRLGTEVSLVSDLFGLGIETNLTAVIDEHDPDDEAIREMANSMLEELTLASPRALAHDNNLARDGCDGDGGDNDGDDDTDGDRDEDDNVDHQSHHSHRHSHRQPPSLPPPLPPAPPVSNRFSSVIEM